jgi:hypothetical protein
MKNDRRGSVVSLSRRITASRHIVLGFVVCLVREMHAYSPVLLFPGQRAKGEPNRIEGIRPVNEVNLHCGALSQPSRPHEIGRS